jgi:hypothetical protein
MRRVRLTNCIALLLPVLTVSVGTVAQTAVASLLYMGVRTTVASGSRVTPRAPW